VQNRFGMRTLHQSAQAFPKTGSRFIPEKGPGFSTARQHRPMLIALTVAIIGVSTAPISVHGQESAENPYALCGGTREACDPFSYLNNEYAIPERGDYVDTSRKAYSRYPGQSGGPWGGYTSPYGYPGPSGYWGPQGPLRGGSWPGAGRWPVPAPFGGAHFGPGFSHGFSGFFGSFNNTGNTFFFGFGNPGLPPFHIGVQPLPRHGFDNGFNSAHPIKGTDRAPNHMNHQQSGFGGNSVRQRTATPH
jgi:hypothetical protein